MSIPRSVVPWSGRFAAYECVVVTDFFKPWRLEIEGKAQDWVLRDVRVGAASIYSQSGDIPGDLFNCSAIDSFVSWPDRIAAGVTVTISAAFCGLGDAPPFVCKLHPTYGDAIIAVEARADG